MIRKILLKFLRKKMTSKKKVINILRIILTLLYFCNSRDLTNYSTLEMLYEDPLVFETWSFVREFYKKSEYIENDKEICYFLSSNWKYIEHNIYIEYIFATKDYENLKIKLFKIIINHDETKFKSYKHDIEGAWNIIEYEKMKPDLALLINDQRIDEIKNIIQNYLNRGQKYKIEKINDIFYYEKVNQVKESNVYICSLKLSLIKKGYNDSDTIDEEFLIEEDIPSGNKSLRYVIYRNPHA